MRFQFVPLLFCLLLSPFAQAGMLERLFAPEAELWPFWDTQDATSTQTIDHSAWNHFLQRHVQQGDDGINRVYYVEVKDNDHSALQDYIAQLQIIPIRQYNRQQQLAYWINLYNALTVDIVLQHYPVASIRDIDISPGLFGDGPWGKKLLSIEDQDVSLNDIEHRILRPIWREPRLHYALNCASLGCPNLQAQAYTTANMEQTLDAAARAYINHPRGVRIDNGRLIVSSIYSWFREDFGENEAAVIGHLRNYARPELARQLQGLTSIADDKYDWRLNDSQPKPEASKTEDSY